MTWCMLGLEILELFCMLEGFRALRSVHYFLITSCHLFSYVWRIGSLSSPIVFVQFLVRKELLSTN